MYCCEASLCSSVTGPYPKALFEVSFCPLSNCFFSIFPGQSHLVELIFTYSRACFDPKNTRKQRKNS